MPRFELSDGVELRSLTEADVKELYALIEANRSYLAPWMPWAAGQTAHGTAEFVRKSIKQEADDDGFQVAVIVDGAIAGVLGHELDRENRTTTIGYWLAEDQQGRGLMTAAVKRLLGHAFDELRPTGLGSRWPRTTPAAARSQSAWVSARKGSCAKRSGSPTTTTATSSSIRCSPPSGREAPARARASARARRGSAGCAPGRRR